MDEGDYKDTIRIKDNIIKNLSKELSKVRESLKNCNSLGISMGSFIITKDTTVPTPILGDCLWVEFTSINDSSILGIRYIESNGNETGMRPSITEGTRIPVTSKNENYFIKCDSLNDSFLYLELYQNK